MKSWAVHYVKQDSSFQRSCLLSLAKAASAHTQTYTYIHTYLHSQPFPFFSRRPPSRNDIHLLLCTLACTCPPAHFPPRWLTHRAFRFPRVFSPFYFEVIKAISAERSSIRSCGGFQPKLQELAMASTLSAVRRAAIAAIVVVATMGSTVMAQAPAPTPAESAAPSVLPSIVAPVLVSLLAFVAGKIM